MSDERWLPSKRLTQAICASSVSLLVLACVAWVGAGANDVDTVVALMLGVTGGVLLAVAIGFYLTLVSLEMWWT